MKCTHCGNQEIDEAKFCGQCGSPFSAVIRDSSSEGAENNEWAIRDCVYDWLSDGAGAIFGAFELEESRHEESKVTTFNVKLSGTPSQFTKEGQALETVVEDGNLYRLGLSGQVDVNKKEKIIQQTTVGDGRKLIVYIEVHEIDATDSSETWHEYGQVRFFAYLDILMHPSFFEQACVIAANWNANLAHIQCFIKNEEESVIVRTKYTVLLKYGQNKTVLSLAANNCLLLGYDSWKKFEELSEHSVDGADDLMESGVEKVSNFSNEDGLQEVVQRMIAEGTKKTALAEYIYECMPNSPRQEVINQFINLAKLTPAGAATYYANIKKSKNNIENNKETNLEEAFQRMIAEGAKVVSNTNIVSEWLIYITLSSELKGNEQCFKDGVCHQGNINDSVDISVIGNIGEENEFDHHWMLIQDSNGNKIYEGTFGGKPTLESSEEYLNTRDGLKLLLEKHLRIKSEYSSEYFDFIENLIWKIRPSYALGYLNLPADYTTGGEDVDIDKTAKYYIRKAMAKCDALACNSAHDVEGAFKTMVESADFDTYVNDFEVDIVIK